MLNTPILLITFNRPNHTRKVLERIVEAQPKDLYVFRDHWREDRADEQTKCEQVISVVKELTDATGINVHYLLPDHNLGCGPGPATGITWFFENVEQGMIFEDDCLPSPTIFRFYEDLLCKYRNDKRISIITGTNALTKWRSYRFDYIMCQTGGMTMGCWASWRRAWQMFDFNVTSWNNVANKDKFRRIVGEQAYSNWIPILDKLSIEPSQDAWDYQWAYARLINNTYTLVSTVNQMSNIGFGVESTHTPNENDRRANLMILSCRFPLRGNGWIRDYVFEWEMFQRFSRKSGKSILLRLFLKFVDFIFRR